MKDEERLKRRGRSGDNHIAGRHRLGEGEREREKKKENGKCGMDAQELTFGDSYMPSYVYV